MMGGMLNCQGYSEAARKDSVGRQGATYLAVGISTALLELLLFQAFYQLVKMPAAPANIIAVAVATVANFLLNRGAAFRSSTSLARSALRYVLLFVFNVVIGTAAIVFLINHGLSSLVAKVMVQGCIALWNFFLYRHFVFA